MFLSRILNLNFLKRSATIISKCSLNTQFEIPNRMLPVLSTWIYKENERISNPIFNNKATYNLPNLKTWVNPYTYPFDEVTKINSIIMPPSVNTNSPKEAARLIVIRRKKMKKHKLRKLRKRMRFEWAKLRQKREFKKEKAFQATLIQQCKEAEGFSAEKYVEDKLNKLHEVVIPRYWKGKRLPEFLIRQKMGLPPK